MLLFEAWVFASAPWASFAAEGIHLTPYRQIYRRSAQNTGERPAGRRRENFVVAALLVGVGLVLAYGLLNAPPESPAQLPNIGGVTLPNTAATPSPTPAPSSTVSPTPSASPSGSPTVSPSPS
jgi:hypothetical protein